MQWPCGFGVSCIVGAVLQDASGCDRYTMIADSSWQETVHEIAQAAVRHPCRTVRNALAIVIVATPSQ